MEVDEKQEPEAEKKEESEEKKEESEVSIFTRLFSVFWWVPIWFHLYLWQK